MKLWTIVADYKGGTYIDQALASTIDAALRDVGSRAEYDFLASLLDESLETPVKLDGMKNVWCTTLLFDDELLLINVVLTAFDEMQPAVG
ncbi:MAG: hypothetical protein JNK34_06095 [Tabrizicola sp.]|nr:hypothetical protein [Tabrizicola sp.]